MNIPRSEHPFPQMKRNDWINLNGKWEFEIDYSCSGKEKEFYKRDNLNSEIIVPFCPESKLSGVSNVDFMNCVWYKRSFNLPETFKNKRIIIHFGAVDYYASVYINGKMAGEHKGGYTSFSIDITSFVTEGQNTVTVCAEDIKNKNKATGKQSAKYLSSGCFYTRTTGIWQTVWLEAVGSTYVENFYTYADIENSLVTVRVKLNGDYKNKMIIGDVSFDGKAVGGVRVCAKSANVYMTIPLFELHLWDIGCGNLYDLRLSVTEGDSVIDEVYTYFGMRTVSIGDKGFEINGKITFGRWVLDQGYYPDGIYTAPTDEDLKNDILYSMQLGFNGARLHQKVFEPRFLYWADKLGYLVWGEYANWGLDIRKIESIKSILPEWIESINRDFSHPSIIGWCPFNETWDIDFGRQDNDLIKLIYDVTREIDPTRPVVDTSGNFHVVNYDFYDVHDYEQNAKSLKEHYSHLDENIILDEIGRHEVYDGRSRYKGEIVFVSEYGGIRWTENEAQGWGYGNPPKTPEEFKKRYKDLTEAIMSNPKIFAMCYTQLYDIEQETNGLLTYDRKFKFEPEYFRKINTQKAAIEK